MQLSASTEANFRARNREWAERKSECLPASLQAHVLTGWDDRYGIHIDDKNGSQAARANTFAGESVRDFGDARVGRAYEENEIKDYADNYSRTCARMKSRARRAQFANWFGIEPPKGKHVTDAGACARMDDPMWWRRQLRKVWTRRSEDAMRRAGVIRRGRAPYASDEAVRHLRARQGRTREWMESCAMVNGEGEQLDLIALHDKSIANPALRRGEFMTRMNGFEEIARDLGHVALFFTLTAPSAFHAQLSAGGINPKYQRQTVRDAQAWLRKMWARSRAKLARLSIQFYGFRVAEPHHDGTPHWHMVLFVRNTEADILQRVLSGVWLSEFTAEPGASEHRCKVVAIDPDKGSATGYIAKYVSKNIDGAGAIGNEISDETGEPISDGVQRVAAWASCHGIRQFQQVGGPPVGLWRELRRQREPVEAETIERARATADSANWRGFIESMGGLERAKKRVHSVREKYWRECIVTPATAGEFPAVWLDMADPRRADAQGREVYAQTRYGEQAPRRPAGVVSFGLFDRWASINTRPHIWRIERKCTLENAPHVGPKGHTYTPQSSTKGKSIHARTHSTLSRRHATGRNSSNWLGESARGSDSESFSDLGPVAITVRSPDWPDIDRPDDGGSDLHHRAHETRAGPKC